MDQNLLNLLAVAAMAVLAVVSLVLMLWCRYDDGIVGKVGLLLIVLGAGYSVIRWFEGGLTEFDSVCASVLVGMALCHARHLWRRRWRFREWIWPHEKSGPGAGREGRGK